MGNRVVGTATAVNYRSRFAWIGMVLVDADSRGRDQECLMRDALVFSPLPARLDATPKRTRSTSNFVEVPAEEDDEYPSSTL
jgi:hypothetical protein